MQETLKLSKRLQTIAGYIPDHAYFADIGSDHAYLPCYVCLQDKRKRAIAGEVQQGPFKMAQNTVKVCQLSSQIDVRLGNGLAVIHENDPVDTIIIAGMGGKLITEILKKGNKKIPSVQRFILQPNTAIDRVRKFLQEQSIPLVDEKIVEDHQQIYEIIVADRSGSNLYMPRIEMEKQLLFGPKLLQERSPLFLKKWQREYEQTNRVVQQMQQANIQNYSKIALFQKQLKWMEGILSE